MSAQDPLYVIFEHHLFSFQDSNIDQKTFIDNIIKDYFAHLRKRKSVFHVWAFEKSTFEELEQQLRIMLIKKIYGFLTISEYQKQVSEEKRTLARRRYKSLRSKAKV